MEIILGEPSRLERLATDIHNHYVSACDADPNRIQKAMVVCSNRKIAYALLSKFKDKYPEWFEEKKAVSYTHLIALQYTGYYGICSRRGKGRKIIWRRRKQLKRH